MLKVQVNGPLPKREREEQTGVPGEKKPDNESENLHHIIIRGENSPRIKPSPSAIAIW